MKNNPHNINKELSFALLVFALIAFLLFCFVSSFGQSFSDLSERTDSIYYKPKVDSMAIWATVDSIKLDSIKHSFEDLKPFQTTVSPINILTVDDLTPLQQGRLIVHVNTVKIGTIEIDEDEAKEYFKDCYEHGDTVFIKTYLDYVIYNDITPDRTTARVRTYTKKEIDTMYEKAREYNDRLRKEGRFLGDGIFVMVRMPSEQDYIKWLHNRK